MLRRRFWVEILLGGSAGVLAIVTLLWRDWIEIVFGVDPDEGNGSIEWLVVVTLLVISVGLFVSARIEWRRAQVAD
jgi:hypothetical protein